MSEMVAMPARLPHKPVTVTVTVPVAVALPTVKVIVLVPGVLAGLNEADTPPGRPAADSVTLELKPFWGVTVMVLEPLAPGMTVRLLGEAERLKLP